jgi:hypothetical protein
MTMGYPKLGEADPGGLGACPQENSTVSSFLLFQKRSKSVSSASQKTMGYPELGEADPGGLGACPQKNFTLSHWKKSNALLVPEDPNLCEADPGGLGAFPQKNVTKSFLINYVFGETEIITEFARNARRDLMFGMERK